MGRRYYKKMAAGGTVGVPSIPVVNQVTPPTPFQLPPQAEPVNADSGATAQKQIPPPVSQMLPKTAHTQDGYTMNIAPRFLLQDLVVEAQANAMDRARIAKEASVQLQKTAECSCGRYPCECAQENPKHNAKTGAADEVTTDLALKLASAVEYLLPHVVKMAAAPVEPGKGPGALPVMESNVAGTSTHPGGTGKATEKNLPPKTVGAQSSTPSGPATQMPNTINTPPGGKGEQQTAMSGGKGKTAEDLYAGNLAILHKMADDWTTRAGAAQDIDAMAALHGISPEDARAMFVNKAKNLGGGLLGATGGLTGLTVGAGIGDMIGGNKGALIGGLGGAALGTGAGYLGGRALAGPDAELTAAYHKAQQQKAAPLVAEPKLAALADLLLATTKQAEEEMDAAHISSGAAVPPAATQSGEGTPPLPSGASMVGSNEAAINYTKQQAKAEPKRDMSAYVSEPALSSAHDNTLQQAFSHTSQAGVKISSADAAMQVSAARSILENIAAAANKRG